MTASRESLDPRRTAIYPDRSRAPSGSPILAEVSIPDSSLEAHRHVLARSIPLEGLGEYRLSRIIDRCEYHEFPDGGLILAEGDSPRGLYIILSGEVEFFLPEERPDGESRMSRVRFRLSGEGEMFGEYSLVDLKPASATARAVGTTAVCLLPLDEFQDLVEREDAIGRVVYRNLLRALVQRLREKDASLDDILGIR